MATPDEQMASMPSHLPEKTGQPLEEVHASGSFNAMGNHRMRISDPAEVDAELIRWLRRAYEEAS